MKIFFAEGLDRQISDLPCHEDLARKFVMRGQKREDALRAFARA
jgi:hypothetical protein